MFLGAHRLVCYGADKRPFHHVGIEFPERCPVALRFPVLLLRRHVRRRDSGRLSTLAAQVYSTASAVVPNYYSQNVTPFF